MKHYVCLSPQDETSRDIFTMGFADKAIVICPADIMDIFEVRIKESL